MQFVCTFVVWITVQIVRATNTSIIITTPMVSDGTWFTTEAKCSYNLDRTYNQLQIQVAIVTNSPVYICSLNAQNMRTSSVGGYTYKLRNNNIQNAGDFSVIFEMECLTDINISGHCNFTIPQQDTITASTRNTATESTIVDTSTSITVTDNTVTESTVVDTSTSITIAASTAIDNIFGETLLSSACMCPCDEIGRDANRNYTEEEIVRKIEEVVKELTIDKHETSAAKSRRISAADDRPSAKAVGTMGIVVLSVTLGILILFDVDNVIRFIIELKQK